MRINRTGTAIAFAAAATLIAGGAAQATVGTVGPTAASLQMCGTVYQNNTETSVHDYHDAVLSVNPTDSGDTKLAGYRISGTLTPGFLGSPASYQAISDANGNFCMQGASGMVAAITSGGYVTITNVEAPGFVPASYSLAHTTINAATFNDHKTSLNSASGFHVKIN